MNIYTFIMKINSFISEAVKPRGGGTGQPSIKYR